MHRCSQIGYRPTRTNVIENQHYRQIIALNRINTVRLKASTGGGAYWAGRAVARPLFAANGQAM